MHIIRPVEATLVSSTVAEDEFAHWDVATTYSLGDTVINNHGLYTSTIDGNVGLDPALENQNLEGARWLFSTATNRTRFQDGNISRKTTGDSPLIIEIQMDEAFDSMALFGLECSACLVEKISGGTATVVQDIRSGAEPVDNWLSWMQSSFYPTTSRMVQSVSGFAGSSLRFTITGEAPAIGEIVVGRRLKVGETLQDSKTKTVHKTFTTIKTELGETTVTKRANVRDVTYYTLANRDGFDGVQSGLDAAVGIPIAAYSVEGDWPQHINFGYLTDFEIPAEYQDHFLIELTVQGVT